MVVSNWQEVVDKTDTYVRSLGIPKVALSNQELDTSDMMPSDPSNLSGKDLSDKLFEYSAYESYLDAELGRVESQIFIIHSYLDNAIATRSYTSKQSKPKAKVALLIEDLKLEEAEDKFIELKAISRRVEGLRDAFHVRMQAVSREISRRASLA